MFVMTDDPSSYGIFRLTDPPGLKIILDCAEKDAFHPHPDLPIYTVSHATMTHCNGILIA